MSEYPKSGWPSASVREIRALGRPEANSLSRIWTELYPHDRVTAAGFAGDVKRLVKGGGRAWIIHRESVIVGYGSVVATPGLPGLYELDGFVAPAYQRQGLASFLLRSILKQSANSDVRQLSHPVKALDSAAAHFLLKNGFYVEHEEQHLVLHSFEALSEAQLDEAFSTRTYGQRKAITLFRQLYETAFAGQAWYQPYESDQEVARDLSDPDDLLFLMDRGRPVGFLWLRWPGQQLVEIEPVGLLPSHRGLGLGRQLMLSGLAHAAQQGADRARVGVWRKNVAALALYQRLGFRMTGKTVYLAYDV